MEAVVARLNTEKCLEVLWVQGNCGRQGNELADEEAKIGLAETQPAVRLDCTTRRAVIRRASSNPCISTALHTATYPTNLSHREDLQMSTPDMTHLRRFRSGHHHALRRWQHLISQSKEATCRLCNYEEDTAGSVVPP